MTQRLLLSPTGVDDAGLVAAALRREVDSQYAGMSPIGGGPRIF
jgi:hypothetical protein